MADPSGPTVATDPEQVDAPTTGETSDAADVTDPVEAPPAEQAEPTPVQEEEATPAADVAGTDAADEPTPVDDAPGDADVPAESGVSVAKAPAEPVADPPTPLVDEGEDEDEVAADLDGGQGDLADDGDGDDHVDEGTEGTEPRGGGLLTKQVSLDARTILIVVAVLALGVGAYVLGQRQGDNAGKAAAPTTVAKATGTTGAFKVPTDYVPFEDKDTGVKLAVPKEWAQYSTKDLDRSYRLLLGVPDAKDNLRVRVNAYSSEVTQANVGDQKRVVDSIFLTEKIVVLADEVTTLNGLPALFYVYKFTDPAGEAGVHAHFFVFQGRKMVSLVFEAVPEDRYKILAGVFDTIAGSLEVTPGPPPAYLEELAGGTGTSVPGATTVPPTTAPPPTG